MFSRQTSTRVEGSVKWLKNHRKMLQYLYSKARLEAKQAESAVRDARKRSCCEAEWMAAVTHLAGRRDNLEWQFTKKRRLDEDAVVILDTGGKVELDKRAKKANDKFREEEERAESASSSAEAESVRRGQDESASVNVKLTRKRDVSDSASILAAAESARSQRASPSRSQLQRQKPVAAAEAHREASCSGRRISRWARRRES